MESTVMMDCVRIRALGAFTTFYMENGRVSWQSLKYAFKFVVVGDRLIVAPIDDHVTLYAVYSVWDLPLDEAKTKVEAIAKEQWARKNPSVRGAGMIGADGCIVGWRSEGFNVETPHHMRDEIEREVARLFQHELKIDEIQK